MEFFLWWFVYFGLVLGSVCIFSSFHSIKAPSELMASGLISFKTRYLSLGKNKKLECLSKQLE